MLKFIRGKAQQPSADRQKLQRELFAFRKTVHHGFPNKPTALAWDPELRLLAIATASGALKVIGKPGVEFYGQHHTDGPVTRILFLPNQGRLVTLCEDNSLHLWEINDGRLDEVKSQVFEGKLKKISAMCLQSNGYLLLLGTEGGNVYFLNLKTFQMLDTIVYLDVVMQNVSATYKITNPGAVEAIAEQPQHPNQFLIGYARGLIVLWNTEHPGTKQTFVSAQQLESLCWDSAGKRFASSHNDGSYAFWDVEVEAKPVDEPTTLYGPFPCKPVTKLLWRQNEQEDVIIFSGGMPRASYSDKYTVTVYANNGKTHAVLDLTSKVVDFTYITEEDDSEPGILLILAEEELVAVDLSGDDMKMVAAPYLASLHASAVTCCYHTANVTTELWTSLKEAGLRQTKELYSERAWPTLGGVAISGKEEEAANSERKELLLTGHEDGTVRFWDCGGTALSPLYKFTTAPLFNNDEPASPNDDEEEWPPFKKVGTFDPYSDDPRLAVKKVWLCPVAGTLVVAGTAGHTVVATLGEAQAQQAPVSSVNIVSDRDNFVWKGHEALTPSPTPTPSTGAGLQVSSILQLHPPAAITALSCSTTLGLLVIGTAHGLALFDYVRNKPVLVKCTLNHNDLSAAGDAPISRRKSFKKSLRESFRRLRRGRSTRGGGAAGGGTEKRGAQSPSAATSPSGAVEAKPVERQIEARPVDDSMGSMVRCVSIAVTYLVSIQTATPTFWAGTNNGTVYAFTIAMPAPAKRKEVDVHSQLGKEIQLKHRAPVLSIAVVDSSGQPVEERTQSQPGLSHRLLICSEEQFKMFTLPSLKPMCKLKLTAHEGCRVRRVGFARFTTVDRRTTDTCLVCLTNLGDCLVLNVPELRRQLNAAVVPPEDINGITSLTFTADGEAFYLHSSSELQRITLSATKVTVINCKLDLPESAREKPAHNGVEEEADTEEEDEEASSDSDEEKPKKEGDAKEKEAEKKEEELKVAEKEAALNDDAPPTAQLTNGNGMNGVEEHDASTLSCGDITLDSVKDHLINSNHSLSESTVEETKTSVVVKTTTTTIVSEQTISTPPKKVMNLGLGLGLDNICELSTSLDLDLDHLDQISLNGQAPLATMEDVED